MIMLAVAALFAAVPAAAQQGADEITLVYEREVYSYSGENRRDPFLPLTNDNAMGPRFEALALQGVIHSPAGNQSVALISAEGRVYRVRVGDMVGNSRIIEIGPSRVVLAVENFGSMRQEILELPTRGDTNQ